MTIRVARTDWFKAFNYLFASTELKNQEPGKCYLADGRAGFGEEEILAIFQRPDESPIFAIAAYHGPDCGENVRNDIAYRWRKEPVFIMVLNSTDLYGLHMVNLLRLGIAWGGSYRSVDLVEEIKSPNGLLAGMPNVDVRGGGLFVWEGNSNDRRVPYRRLWIPGLIESVTDPTNLLTILSDQPRIQFLHMRNIIERILRSDADSIPDPITPWIENMLAGKYAKKRPGIRGPLYNREEAERSALSEVKPKRRPPMNYLTQDILYPSILSNLPQDVIYEVVEGFTEQETLALLDPTLNAQFQDFLAQNETDSAIQNTLIGESNAYFTGSGEDIHPAKQISTSNSENELEIQYFKSPRREESEESPKIPLQWYAAEIDQSGGGESNPWGNRLEIETGLYEEREAQDFAEYGQGDNKFREPAIENLSQEAGGELERLNHPAPEQRPTLSTLNLETYSQWREAVDQITNNMQYAHDLSAVVRVPPQGTIEQPPREDWYWSPNRYALSTTERGPVRIPLLWNAESYYRNPTSSANRRPRAEGDLDEIPEEGDT
ncbi:hypothetical protein AA313_de0205121 [Arthrobotrys entomopaga]|nr:hypothetical protein AA313_de0205121 [Arthrobotrys entomopaga]